MVERQEKKTNFYELFSMRLERMFRDIDVSR